MRQVCCLGGAAALLAFAGNVAAQQISRSEALASAFPGATIRLEQVFLTGQQQKRAAELTGEDLPTALIARYVAMKNGQEVGRAYVDTHIVRTKKQTLLVMLEASGRVRRVEATAFMEPAEYRAPEVWLRQYENRVLGVDLSLNRAIRPIAGATLTARATNDAIRRVLAIDRVLQETNTGSQK